ncbi:hypothetical protein ACHAXR_003314 [Thalassiosira sp. AJA248-18]
MSSSQTSRICIPKIHAGTPSEEFLSRDSQEWEAIEVCFHNFVNRSSLSGAHVYSPEFTCFGHQWRLKLYPGGHHSSDDGMVAVYLYHQSDESMTIHFGFYVRNKYGEVKYDKVLDKTKFAGGRKGDVNFTKRSDIISDLADGSLIIGVRLRQTVTTVLPSVPFIAENPLPKTILNKFMDEDSSDVVFEVSSGVAMGTPKRTKTSTTFYGHRFILQDWASALEELCKPGGDMTPISISDVKPDIFRHMLYYSYGGRVASDDLKANAKEIIDAADKYGVVGLKLEAEAEFVTSTSITFDNAMDNLLYADGKNCPLLKEAVVDFLHENADEAVKKLSFDDVPGHMVKDILTAVSRGKKEDGASTDTSDLSTVRVSELRKMLHARGLDIDGSRETMIACLEEKFSSENVA